MRRLAPLVGVVLLVLATGLNAQSGSSDVAGLPTARPEAVGISSARLARIGEALNREIAADRMPGAVVAIARRGQVVYYEAFGYLDKAAGTPMPKDAIFAIASMTKPIFSVAAMSLYEEGRLLMNEPVATYLPELGQRVVAIDEDGSQTEPANRQPTIQDLLRHTSGFVARGGGDTALHDRYAGDLVTYPLPAGDYLKTLAALPLRYQPGTTWEYGPGFDILGLAIERITGKPIHTVLTERLFAPIGMTDTAFTIPAGKASRQARPLPRNPLTGATQAMRNQTEPRAVGCGSGCLASTAADYLAFAQMLLNGGRLNGAHVLGQKTVEFMTSDHAEDGVDLTGLHNYPSLHYDDHGFGLGVAVRRSPGGGGTVGSPGTWSWAGSQGTYFWVDTREELVVVHMAQTPGDIRGYYRQLLPALVYQSLVD